MDIVPLTSEFDVSSFTCGDGQDHADLNDFLKSDALRYADEFMSHTYVAVDESGFIAGYVTLLVDAIWLTKDEKQGDLPIEMSRSRTIPAMKVGRLARHVQYRRQGMGTILMRFAVDELMAVSSRYGCRLLCVDAIESAIKFYERLGFVRNAHNNHISKQTTSMRFDPFAPERPDWTRPYQS